MHRCLTTLVGPFAFSGLMYKDFSDGRRLEKEYVIVNIKKKIIIARALACQNEQTGSTQRQRRAPLQQESHLVCLHASYCRRRHRCRYMYIRTQISIKIITILPIIKAEVAREIAEYQRVIPEQICQ